MLWNKFKPIGHDNFYPTTQDMGFKHELVSQETYKLVNIHGQKYCSLSILPF